MHKILSNPIAIILVALLLGAARPQQATTPPATNAAKEDRSALHQALLDLTNPFTVMCIAAHPDDEDGTTLTVLRRKYGVHTVSLFSTYGEGGQNAVGPELYEELGVIRARETMAAAKIQGSEPHFLGLKDFGYSKSADEAFRIWGHEEALRRMVLEIRKLRPAVIITNHTVTNNDHGHHQATARLVVEAFDAAADPKRFPEQLKDGVTVWQVQRLFVRARGQNPDRQGGGDQLVTIDPNERDPIRNTVFAEEALRGLQKHATQGPWPKTFAEFAARFRAFTGQSAAPGQLPLTRYRLTREAKGTEPLPKDSRNFLDGLSIGDSEIVQLVTVAQREISPALSDDHHGVFEALATVWGKGHYVTRVEGDDMPRFQLMADRLNRALAAASEISLTVTADKSVATPGSSIRLSVVDSNHGDLNARLDESATLKPHAALKKVELEKVKDDWTFTTDPLYRDRSRYLEFRVTHRVRIGDVIFPISAATHVTVVPPVEITDITPSTAILTPATGSTTPTKRISFTIKLINHQLTTFNGNLLAASGITHKRTDQVAVKLAAGESKTLTLMTQQPPPVNRAPTNNISFIFQSASANPPLTTVPVVYADAHV